jgi:hypothetical protein
MKDLPIECVHKAFLSGIGSQVKMTEIFSSSRFELRSNTLQEWSRVLKKKSSGG